MTVFTDETTTIVNPLEALVGEGKKFKTVEDLAKSKIEADSFITQLTGETAELKTRLSDMEAELASRKTVEEQLKAITTTKVVPNLQTATTVEPNKGQVITDEDLTNRVRAITERENQSRSAQSNISAVADKLVELYGNEEKANKAVKEKAKELNVSVKFLESTAQTSPQAFFSLIGAPSASVTPQAPRSEVNLWDGTNRQSNQPAPGSYESDREKQGRLDVKKLMDPRYLNETMARALADPDKYLASVA